MSDSLHEYNLDILEMRGVLREEYPDLDAAFIVSELQHIIRTAENHQRTCLARLNDPGMTTARFNNAIANIRRGLEARISKFPGASLETDEDPRGATVFMVLPSGQGNAFGHEGWAVPMWLGEKHAEI